MAGESLAAINISAGGLIGTFNISFSLSGSAARSFYVPEDFPFEVLALGFVTLDIPVLTAGDNKEVQLILTEPVPEGRELELVIQGAESSEVELLFHLGEDSTDSRSPCNSADANCSASPFSQVHSVRPSPAPPPETSTCALPQQSRHPNALSLFHRMNTPHERTLLVVQGFACTMSILTSLSPVPVVLQFRREQSTGECSSVPFVSAFLATTNGGYYGFLTGNSFFFWVCALQTACAALLLHQFQRFAPNPRGVRTQAALVLSFNLCTHLFVMAVEMELARHVVGRLNTVITILNAAAPLSNLAVVLRNKETATMSFPLAVMSFLASLGWFQYGWMIQDTVIWLPMTLNVVLASVQLIMFGIFPTRAKSIPGTEATELSSTIAVGRKPPTAKREVPGDTSRMAAHAELQGPSGPVTETPRSPPKVGPAELVKERKDTKAVNKEV